MSPTDRWKTLPGPVVPVSGYSPYSNPTSCPLCHNSALMRRGHRGGFKGRVRTSWEWHPRDGFTPKLGTMVPLACHSRQFLRDKTSIDCGRQKGHVTQSGKRHSRSYSTVSTHEGRSARQFPNAPSTRLSWYIPVVLLLHLYA